MMVMVPVNGNKWCKEMAVKHPGKIGFICGPSYWSAPPTNMPYVLDNDAYNKRHNWSEADWVNMLKKSSKIHAPLWAAVPDVVGDFKGTLKKWKRFSSIVEEFGIRPRFVVQDGMENHIDLVPQNSFGVFVGGTTRFKWLTAPMWCKKFLTHIGRVNCIGRVCMSEKLGAQSCDGAGWMRVGNDRSQWGRGKSGLEAFFNGWRDSQLEFS